jgi:capsular polysaccharide biosynthesis protein
MTVLFQQRPVKRCRCSKITDALSSGMARVAFNGRFHKKRHYNRKGIGYHCVIRLNRGNGSSVTLLELLRLLRGKWQLLVAFPLIFALCTALYAFTFMSNDYTSSVVLYVLTQTDDESSSSTLSSGDITVSQQLANDIAVLAKSNYIESETAGALGMRSLNGYDISISSATTNRVITLEVTGKNPGAVATVADELAHQTSQFAVDIMDLKAVNVVDAAQVAEAPSGPNRLMFTLIAFVAGLAVAIALILVLDLLNTTVRSPEDAEELLGLPVVGRMPRLK